MLSATLSGEVQQKGPDGVWRTVLTAAGHSVVDNRTCQDEMVKHYVRAPYVPGKAGAYRPY